MSDQTTAMKKEWDIDPSPDDKVLIGTEKAKLTATYLNNMAVALFTVGAAAPLISVFTVAGVRVDHALFSVAACTIISILGHIYAKWQLGVLRK